MPKHAWLNNCVSGCCCDVLQVWQVQPHPGCRAALFDPCGASAAAGDQLLLTWLSSVAPFDSDVREIAFCSTQGPMPA